MSAIAGIPEHPLRSSMPEVSCTCSETFGSNQKALLDKVSRPLKRPRSTLRSRTSGDVSARQPGGRGSCRREASEVSFRSTIDELADRAIAVSLAGIHDFPDCGDERATSPILGTPAGLTAKQMGRLRDRAEVHARVSRWPIEIPRPDSTSTRERRRVCGPVTWRLHSRFSRRAGFANPGERGRPTTTFAGIGWCDSCVARVQLPPTPKPACARRCSCSRVYVDPLLFPEPGVRGQRIRSSCRGR